MANGDQFKSKLKHGDYVSVSYDEGIVAFKGWITCIHLYIGQTKYDVERRFPDSTTSTEKEIASGYIEKIKPEL